MDVGAGARRDRGEADRRERREDGRRAAVLAVRGEVRERRRAAALDAVLERLRRHPVHDDQDELLRHDLVLGERAQAGVALGPPAAEQKREEGKHDRDEVAGDRDEGDPREHERTPMRSATVPARVPPRRRAPTTTGTAPSRPQTTPATAAARSPQLPGCQSAMTQPARKPITRPESVTRIADSRPLPQKPAWTTPIATPIPTQTPIQYHVPTPPP